MAESSNKLGREFRFRPEEIVDVSELREFVFCERAWYLARQGHAVPKGAHSQRTAGVAFHKARAVAAEKGSNAQTVWWIVVLVLVAIALLVVNALLASR
jgi:hypothetical protein